MWILDVWVVGRWVGCSWVMGTWWMVDGWGRVSSVSFKTTGGYSGNIKLSFPSFEKGKKTPWSIKEVHKRSFPITSDFKVLNPMILR